MLPLIIVATIATVLIIALYVLLIRKHYWGPDGPPQKNDKKNSHSR
jgi:hypothetical protein